MYSSIVKQDITVSKTLCLKSFNFQILVAQMSSLFCLPWSRHRSVNQLDTASTNLLTLPPELLLMIALELPLPDAANFALINRRLSMLIGPTYWPHPRTNAVTLSHREQFLGTLARDLPCWFYCHSCSHLHRTNRIRSPGPFDEPWYPLRCTQAQFRDCFYPHWGVSFPRYKILFHHLQLVMRRHYLGPGYGISPNDLAFVHVDELSESGVRGRRTTLSSVEARICTEPARLCLRVQKWALLHTNVLDLAVERADCIGVCIHHKAGEGEMFQLIVSSLDEYLKRSEGSREPKRRKCRRCKFEYQLEVLDTGSDGLAIVITRWLDLGSGLTPSDPKWRFHTESVGQDDGIDHAGNAERCRLEFEKEEGLGHHAITLRNASYLSQQQYRKAMNKVSEGVWILQAGRRRSAWPFILMLSLLLGYLLALSIMGIPPPPYMWHIDR